MHKKAQKSTKSTKNTKKHKNAAKQKQKTQISEQKLEMRLKTCRRKKVTYSLICVFVLVKKSLYNENVGLTKLVKVLSALYEQKLVY